MLNIQMMKNNTQFENENPNGQAFYFHSAARETANTWFHNKGSLPWTRHVVIAVIAVQLS